MLKEIEMTHKEKVKMYQKQTKAKLIEMLIECNIQLDIVRGSGPMKTIPVKDIFEHPGLKNLGKRSIFVD